MIIGYSHCAGCGDFIGNPHGNHHCPTKRIVRLEATRNSYWDREPRTDCRDSYGTKLSTGFAAMHGSNDYDD